MIARKIDYLIALAKEAHFARAAAVCGVSQPTLSAGIQQLELEMGVQIVKRGRRFQGFTPEGEMILATAQRLAEETARLQRDLRNRGGPLSRTLRMTVLNSAVPLLQNFLFEFEERYPEASLAIIGQNAFGIQQGLEESSSDIVITYLDHKTSRYRRSHTLYVEEYERLIKRGTKFSGAKSVSWEDARRLPLCLMVPEMRVLGSDEAGILSDIQNNVPHVSTNLIGQLMRHVRTGKWASVLPKPVEIMIAGDPEFEAIALPAVREPVSVGIAIPDHQPTMPLAEALFELVTSKEMLRKIRESLQGRPTSVQKPSARKAS